ncbi:MAG: hypothetical protein F6K19_47880 [Cyanothece sp. SIO1E1]|nr:hypothetical protein [Cyanothece sp. SIO1E1]
MKQTFTERTHSGGWRFAVQVGDQYFTNFSLAAGGKHVGEALGKGRFTVLAPTIGPSGNPYVNLQRIPPVRVESLETIGLYPVNRRRQHATSSQPRPRTQSLLPQPGVLRLEDLATGKAQAILNGDSPLESRSHSLTFAIQEFYGWENWAAQNRIPISGSADDLAREAGAALGIDTDRIERIIQSIPDPGGCIPATLYSGDETSSWKRVWKIDRGAYDERCPDDIKQLIHDSVLKNTLRFGNKAISRRPQLKKL